MLTRVERLADVAANLLRASHAGPSGLDPIT